MLAVAMPAPKKSTAKKPAAPEGRKKSKLTQAGDRAKWETERALLLKTLKAKGWNLTHAAAELEMSDASAVLAAIKRLGLQEDHDKARGYRLTRVPV